MMTPRINNMMYYRRLVIVLKPQAPETGTARNWYECAWFKAEMQDHKSTRIFQGEGMTPDEAIKDLLECNAFAIEALCQETGGPQDAPLSS